MSLIFDLNPPNGGILIRGSEEELRDLSDVIEAAANGSNSVVGQLLTEDGVEDLVVEVEGEAS